jgi:tetratricopeptide (TPR) repeat protein
VVLKALADALLEEHQVSDSLETMEEAIAVYEEISQLCPAHDEQRAKAISDLAGALMMFCHDHGECSPWVRGRRCIELFREGLNLRPPGHVLRDQSLYWLGKAVVSVKHEDISEWGHQVTESIALLREALELRPVGHLERHATLEWLGISLNNIYELSGDQETLEEAISTKRQVLLLRPPGHALRRLALNNLGVGLRMWFEHRGGLEKLTEAISLLREALSLSPAGQSPRTMVLDNLSWAILLCAKLQGRSEQFTESISLRREALALLSASDPERGRMMLNLSGSLMDAFQHDFASSEVVDEAIHLFRESLRLRRSQGLLLDSNMSSLSEALVTRFDLNQDHEDLLEALSLQRQSLQLRPTGNWRRMQSLQRLANLLCRSECRLWSEALLLFREALELSPLGFPDRSPLISDMSKCFLESSSPFLNLEQGIALLSEAHTDQFCHVAVRLKSAVSNLRRAEDVFCAMNHDPHAHGDDDIAGRILDLYIEVIVLLPRAANFGLDHSSRLQAVIGSDEISRNAAARALHLGRIPHAVEMLEEGRGVFWSQTLHLRAAGFDGVPEHDRQKLKQLLQSLEFSTQRAQNSEMSITQREQDLESRRKLNEEAEALITTIRGYPGLARFLMPAAFADLVRALPSGYVVILNSSTLGQHALLFNSAIGLATSLELQASHREFDSDTIRSQVDRNALREGNNESVWDDTRAMKLSVGRLRSLDDTLALMWNTIVRPVFEKLHIEVCATGTTVN